MEQLLMWLTGFTKKWPDSTGNGTGLYEDDCRCIALAIPAAIPSSPGFYYREKGIMGLIMGQSTLLVYMADFTYSLISRAIGTAVGGVAGLVVWYFGSGNGSGNPYGLGAAMAVAVAILMWARLVLNSALLQATIFSAATCLIVVGYSYDDT